MKTETEEMEKDDKFPTLTKDNIDAWYSLTYGWIIRGMLETETSLQSKYGRAMTLAENLTERLFIDVKKAYRLDSAIGKDSDWSENSHIRNLLLLIRDGDKE